jgi:hypothetical protein
MPPVDTEKNDTLPPAAPKAAKTTAKMPRKPLDQLIYLGPSRPYGKPLMRNTVFSGGQIPDFCRELAAEHPHFKACFVPVAEAGNNIAALADKKSAISKACTQVEADTRKQAETAAEKGA